MWLMKSIPAGILGALLGGVGGFVVFGILQLIFGWSGESVSFLSKLSALILGTVFFVATMQGEKAIQEMESTSNQIDKELKKVYGENYRDLYSGNYGQSTPSYKEKEYIIESPITKDPKQRIVEESNGNLRIEDYWTKEVQRRIRKK